MVKIKQLNQQEYFSSNRDLNPLRLGRPVDIFSIEQKRLA